MPPGVVDLVATTCKPRVVSHRCHFCVWGTSNLTSLTTARSSTGTLSAYDMYQLKAVGGIFDLHYRFVGVGTGRQNKNAQGRAAGGSPKFLFEFGESCRRCRGRHNQQRLPLLLQRACSNNRCFCEFGDTRRKDLATAAALWAGCTLCKRFSRAE